MTTTMGRSIDADTTDADLDTDTFAVAGGISGRLVLLLQLSLLLLKKVMRIQRRTSRVCHGGNCVKRQR